MFEDESFKKILNLGGWFLAVIWNPILIHIFIKVGLKDPQGEPAAMNKYWLQVSIIMVFAYAVAVYCIYTFRKKSKK